MENLDDVRHSQAYLQNSIGKWMHSSSNKIIGV